MGATDAPSPPEAFTGRTRGAVAGASTHCMARERRDLVLVWVIGLAPKSTVYEFRRWVNVKVVAPEARAAVSCTDTAGSMGFQHTPSRNSQRRGRSGALGTSDAASPATSAASSPPSSTPGTPRATTRANGARAVGKPTLGRLVPLAVPAPPPLPPPLPPATPEAGLEPAALRPPAPAAAEAGATLRAAALLTPAGAAGDLPAPRRPSVDASGGGAAGLLTAVGRAAWAIEAPPAASVLPACEVITHHALKLRCPLQAPTPHDHSKYTHEAMIRPRVGC
jgi:hypothetical protein